MALRAGQVHLPNALVVLRLASLPSSGLAQLGLRLTRTLCQFTP
jgi:hypothetical protein